MAITEKERKSIIVAIADLLPDDDLAAAGLILSAAAIIVASAGFSDLQAANGFGAALQKVRELGVGEEQH